jgi:adenine phosphoribosyltransferase
MLDLAPLIRDIPDFPRQGILFKDITTLLSHPAAFKQSIDQLIELVRPYESDVVVGMESRGFIFAAPIAYALGLGFVPVRKLGKLPGPTVQTEYELEYGTNTLELHRDGIQAGQRVVVVDDLLATGGTVAATIKLIETLGGVVVATAFLVELTELRGRDRLERYPVHSLMMF